MQITDVNKNDHGQNEDVHISPVSLIYRKFTS